MAIEIKADSYGNKPVQDVKAGASSPSLRVVAVFDRLCRQGSAVTNSSCPEEEEQVQATRRRRADENQEWLDRATAFCKRGVLRRAGVASLFV